MKLKFFKLAKLLAQKSDYHAHKLGAVITNGNKVIGVGFNRNRTHPKSNNKWRTLHAELSAILNSGKENLFGCQIYIYRETKTRKLANSFPCEYCQELIKQVGIDTVYYSHEEGYKKEKI